MRPRFTGLVASSLLLAACQGDSPTLEPLEVPTTAFSIGDGGTGGAVPGVHWLAPTLKDGETFTGTFDPGLEPSIDICPIASDALDGSAACSGAPIRTLSADSPPEIFRVDEDNENYSVNWLSTGDPGIAVGDLFRAVLRVGSRELGWIDLQAVAKQRDVRGLGAGFAGLVVGQPFLFKVRIETGIPGEIVVTPSTTSLEDDETADFTAVVTDLHGVVLPGAAVAWSIDDGAIASLAPVGGVTDGAGETQTTLTPEPGIGGSTTVRAASQGIEGTADVTVIRSVASVVVTPTSATIYSDETQVFTATLLDLLDNPIAGRGLAWDADPSVGLSAYVGTSDGAGQMSVTASPIDAAGVATILAAAGGVQGSATLTFNDPCAVGGRDTDGDRLLDCHETGTNVFVSPTNTGTSPTVADTDGDDIDDGDEVLGTTAGLNLPALGVNPLRKDLLLEYDWFDDSICGSPHSHRPTAATVGPMTAAFAAAPVANPDGSTGINIINDYGQGGLFTGGNFIADADGVIAGNVFGADFANYKAAQFAANRVGYFHYVMMIHSYDTNSGSSGYAEIVGDDLIVSLNCYGTDLIETNTIMHELGHNIGLRHGGGADGPNYKPNYNSVMNYQYQFSGVDSDCVPWGDGVTDFSYGDRPALDEAALDESLGLCGAGPPWDWDGNNVIDPGTVSWSINGFNGGSIDNDNVLSVLTDYDDWANVTLGGLPNPPGPGQTLSFVQVEGVACPAPPWIR